MCIRDRYDAFGNMTRETLALAEQPAPGNSPIREYAFSVENAEDGIYMVTVSYTHLDVYKRQPVRRGGTNLHRKRPK